MTYPSRTPVPAPVCARSLASSTPFNDMGAPVEEFVRSILHDPIVLPTDENIGLNEVAFIRALLERNPTLRLGTRGIDQVLTHVFFAGAAQVPGG